jgi:hypothetical protein
LSWFSARRPLFQWPKQKKRLELFGKVSKAPEILTNIKYNVCTSVKSEVSIRRVEVHVQVISLSLSLKMDEMSKGAWKTCRIPLCLGWYL